MALASDARLLALHAVRVKGIATADAIADLASLPAESVGAVLRDLASCGLVSHRDGRITGWSLTTEGRAQHAKLLADELDAAGAREAVHACYRDFLAVNTRLLGVCTAWQLKPDGDGNHQLNQHDDPAYDHAVVAELGEVDDAIQPVCARLGDALERFSRYGPRLRGARRQVEAGAVEWFTKPLIDSYHTVWFELHEDLLSTLGIERSKEEA